MTYYDTHSDEYIAQTRSIDMQHVYDTFISHLPPEAHILDAGCGSGRDTRYFLQHGYSVEAFDASPELAKCASQYTGIPVACLRFQDMDYYAQFDGIWASATLLHLTPEELPGALDACYDALKTDGTLFCSFKYGDSLRHDARGRRFLDMNEQTLEAALLDSRLRLLNDPFCYEAPHPDGIDQIWINALATKRCAP